MIAILIVKDNYHLGNTGINSRRRLYFNIDVFYFILMKMEKMMMIKDLSLAWSFLFNLLQQIYAIIPIFLYGKIKRILPVPFCFIQQVNNSWLYLNEDNICHIWNHVSVFLFYNLDRCICRWLECYWFCLSYKFRKYRRNKHVGYFWKLSY